MQLVKRRDKHEYLSNSFKICHGYLNANFCLQLLQNITIKIPFLQFLNYLHDCTEEVERSLTDRQRPYFSRHITGSTPANFLTFPFGCPAILYTRVLAAVISPAALSDLGQTGLKKNTPKGKNAKFPLEQAKEAPYASRRIVLL